MAPYAGSLDYAGGTARVVAALETEDCQPGEDPDEDPEEDPDEEDMDMPEDPSSSFEEEPSLELNTSSRRDSATRGVGEGLDPHRAVPSGL
ncbi:hypothetical protein CYMTET_7134 [Cymbomonas tetramitiformis]|uniref:Uncharacterized protein n=1 Tax=Cymbomonas tetramitiformis TaxID=36881 RepID=A0AAE0BYK6_9CHLO|nr:hypothetical protein CYMTET_48023 [Cymbomonas tetramitiformis]KAK3244499.1 hypothetical protein CYMTET_45888 [Cymbomonas tetramitiformis]KAK3275472.1 hypothetical protein CYMTET_16402 [Cymbomonas tetramitiformis]KAK3285248.1 hypothetical protein CYMTET_7134 [Cymbomonas tetramitiformis]